MNNPKVNYTKEDNETYLKNLFMKMLLERNHPRIYKKVNKEASRLAKKYLKENNVDNL